MKRFGMTRIGAVATGAVVAALLGGGLVAAPTASAAAAYTVCDGSSSTDPGNTPYFRTYPINKAGFTIYCYLTYEDTGAGVRALQKNMNSCYGKRLELDGIFGTATRTALRDVQGRIGATVDGEYGPETLTKMKWARYSDETGAKHDCL